MQLKIVKRLVADCKNYRELFLIVGDSKAICLLYAHIKRNEKQ